MKTNEEKLFDNKVLKAKAKVMEESVRVVATLLNDVQNYGDALDEKEYIQLHETFQEISRELDGLSDLWK